MCRINAEIAAHDAAHKAASNKGNTDIKQKRKPEKIWRYEENEIDIDYGIIAQVYINDVLLKEEELYDFVKATQAGNSNRSVYLIEDDAEAHAKAFAALKEERHKRDIVKVD